MHSIRLNRNTTLYFPVTFMTINQTVSIFSKNISIILPSHLRSFDRITLVNKKKTERLTIDMNLNFLNTYTGITKSLEKLAVIELKRDGLVYSPVLEMLRTLRILPMGFSKYCIGSAITNLALKRNRILPKLRQIEKISVV